jgi:hypothetical protein
MGRVYRPQASQQRSPASRTQPRAEHVVLVLLDEIRGDAAVVGFERGVEVDAVMEFDPETRHQGEA